ncbi:MAG: tetratricopeptide repeat protein [Flavobacteriaceae bacterium]|nr:tetratricopeptide repeat protein [Flavobacteriaceae bacterium]
MKKLLFLLILLFISFNAIGQTSRDKWHEIFDQGLVGAFMMGVMIFILLIYYFIKSLFNKTPENSNELDYKKYLSEISWIEFYALALAKKISNTFSGGDKYFDSAVDKAKNRDYSGAIIDYTKAIELDPNCAVTYFNRGLAKDKLKDYNGAIADYTKTIELDPDYVKAYRNRGLKKEDIGDLNGACSDWKKAASMGDADSKNWVAYQCN